MYLLLKSSLSSFWWFDSKVLHNFLNEFMNLEKDSLLPKGCISFGWGEFITYDVSDVRFFIIVKADGVYMEDNACFLGETSLSLCGLVTTIFRGSISLIYPSCWGCEV